MTSEQARESAEKARESLIDRLHAEGAIDLASKLERCGERVPLNCIGCGERRFGRTRCDKRWCPVCQRAIAAQTSIRYAAIVKDAQWPSIMNLTTLHKAGDAMSIRQMRTAFTKLRRLKWFKEKVRGGVAAFEVTEGDNGVHVHVHAIIDCKWLSVTTTAPRVGATKEEWRRKGQAARIELSEQWGLCTGRKGDVWVKRESDVERIVREQLKYNVKGSDLANKAKVKGKVAPIIRSMTGCRLLSSWGTMYRHPAIKRQDKPPAMCKCGCNDWLLERSVDLIVKKSRPVGRQMVHFATDG